MNLHQSKLFYINYNQQNFEYGVEQVSSLGEA